MSIQVSVWEKDILPWIVCFSASLFFTYEVMQHHIINAISPMLIRDLQLSGVEFSYLSSTYLLADVTLLLPAAVILDRFSVRRVILFALFLCILGAFGFSISHSMSFACLSHFLTGIGNAFCFLSCVILISRWFPKERQAFMIGLIMTMGMLGGVVAQSPFSLLAERFHWRQALLIDGLAGLLIFVLLFFFVKDAPNGNRLLQNEFEQERAIPFWKGVKHSLFNQQNIYCGIYTGFLNLPLMLISTLWGTLFLVQVHQIALTKASFIVSMVCVGTIVGSPIYGWVSDKIKRRLSPMIFGASTSFVIIMMILFVAHPSDMLLTILFFLLGVATSSQVVGYPLIVESNSKQLTGTSMGIAVFITMGMAVLIQPLSGVILDNSWDGAMVDGIPHYALNDFRKVFAIFPIGFILALAALFKVKEPPKKTSLLRVSEPYEQGSR